MLDLKKCPGCGSNTSLSTDTCPYCGYRFDAGEGDARPSSPAARQRRCPNCDAPVPANRSVCPNCKAVIREKRGLGTCLLMGGFVIAVILLAVFVFRIPGTPMEGADSSHLSVVTAAPTVPACNIAITGQKLPTGMIQLRLMALTCGPGDVSELRVIINGKNAGTLPYQPGSLGTFPGRKGSDQVTVVAVFSSGYEKIVFDSTYA